MNLPLGPLPKKALLHGHCHQKAFDAMGAVEATLRLIPQLSVETIESSCCGMAGSFGYDAATIDVSRKMGELSLLPAVRRANADTLIVADGTSCRHQIYDGPIARRSMSPVCWRQAWRLAAAPKLRHNGRMPDKLFPTSLVGSYPQPDWLIDRARLSKMVPRVRMDDLWLIDPKALEAKQDEATLLAIRDQERAGLDIITDGEQRRESYSNRFATALEGVDTENPGSTLNRSGKPIPVPRVTGKIRRKHPVELRDLQFLRANTKKPVKMTVPGPFTMSKQAQNDFYQSATKPWRSTMRKRSMRRSRTCSRPAPTSCRSTSRGCSSIPRRRATMA